MPPLGKVPMGGRSLTPRLGVGSGHWLQGSVSRTIPAWEPHPSPQFLETLLGKRSPDPLHAGWTPVPHSTHSGYYRSWIELAPIYPVGIPPTRSTNGVSFTTILHVYLDRPSLSHLSPPLSRLTSLWSVLSCPTPISVLWYDYCGIGFS